MNRDQRWFVTQMGQVSEEDGLTRIAGRIFAFLLLSDAPCSIDMLAGSLKVSKASVSTETRRLLARGVVARSRRPADRRAYYAIAPDFFARQLAYRLARRERLRALVRDARRRLRTAPELIQQRLEYMEVVQEFVLGRADDALAEWRLRIARRRRLARR